MKQKLFGHRCCGRGIHRIGRYGYDGGYFYDAPITSSKNFGFYSSGCGSCDQSTHDDGVADGQIETHGSVIENPYVNQGISQSPIQNGINEMNQSVPFVQPNCTDTVCEPGSLQSFVPQQNIDSNASFSPAGEVLPGEIVNDGGN